MRETLPGETAAQDRSDAFSWADAAVLSVAVVWGASYPVAKAALTFAPVLLLIAIRFGVSTVTMGVVARQEILVSRPSDLLRGAALGLILAMIFLAETYGVAATTASNAAFIISLCTLLTPLLDHALARSLPPAGIVVGACLSCAGVAVLSGGLSSLGSGDALMLAAAVLRACMVVATQRAMAGRRLSSAALTSVQAAVVTAVAATTMLATGHSVPVFPARLDFWFAVAFLSLFCTVGAFYIQNAAVRRTSPTRVGFLMGTEPVFASLIAVTLFGEALRGATLVGGFLVLAGTGLGLVTPVTRKPPAISTGSSRHGATP